MVKFDYVCKLAISISNKLTINIYLMINLIIYTYCTLQILIISCIYLVKVKIFDFSRNKNVTLCGTGDQRILHMF